MREIPYALLSLMVAGASCSDDDETGRVKLQIIQIGDGMASLPNSATEDGAAPEYHYRTLTPESLSLLIGNIELVSFARNYAETFYTCPTPGDCTADLLPTNTGLVFSTGNGAKVETGEYDEVKLTFKGSGSECGAYIQGDFTLAGTTYRTGNSGITPFVTTKAPFLVGHEDSQGCANSFQLPSPINITQSSDVTIYFYIDITHTVLIGDGTFEPSRWHEPLDCTGEKDPTTGEVGEPFFCYGELTFGVALEHSVATVERYVLRLNESYAPGPSALYTLLFDANDQFVAGIATPYLVEGLSTGSPPLPRAVPSHLSRTTVMAHIPWSAPALISKMGTLAACRPLRGKPTRASSMTNPPHPGGLQVIPTTRPKCRR